VHLLAVLNYDVRVGTTIAARRLGAHVAAATIAATTLAACFAKPDRPAVAADAAAPADAIDAVVSSIEFIDSNRLKALGVPSLTVVFGQPIVAGDLIVVALGTYGGDVLMVEDTGGNTYRDAMITVATQLNGKLAVFYAVNTALAPTLMVTATVNGSTDNELSMAIHAYRGTDPVEPLDQHSASTDLASTTPSSGELTTAHADGLYFGVLSHDAMVSTTAGPDYTLREVVSEDPADVPLATEDKFGPAQTTAATFQLSGTSASACALVTFK
jgi:hypothetical protein